MGELEVLTERINSYLKNKKKSLIITKNVSDFFTTKEFQVFSLFTDKNTPQHDL